MALLHVHSKECLKSELDIFSLPPTQTTIEKSSWVHYKPVSSLTDDSPIEFVVPGNWEEYLDLAHTLLSVRVSMTAPDTAVPIENSNADHVGPVNNFMHSLFSQVDVQFNQRIVSPPSNTYAYRAYIETLLNYGPAANESHLSTVLWWADTAGKMDDRGTSNMGLVERRAMVGNKKKKIIDMISPLHTDLFNQERMLLNGVGVRVRLVQARDGFAIMDPTGFHGINITDATLLVRRVKISPSVFIAHANKLSKTTAKYPLTRVDVKSVSLHSGILSESIDNIILGQLPTRVIIGFVTNKAFNGQRDLNPFNFQHFNINYLSLYVDGVQVPSKPLQPDFQTEHLYIDAYHTLFTGTGIHFLNQGNSITRRAFAQGYCLFAFDLTPDLSANENHWNLIKHGSVRIDVRFDKPLSEPVNCIVYAEFENILETRQCMADYYG